MTKYKFAIYLFWPLIAFVSAMAWLPVSNPAVTESNPDKFNHIAAFFVLTVVFNLAYTVNLVVLASIMMLYGILIELVQYFLPYRFFDLNDIVADAIGIFLACSIIYAVSIMKGDNNEKV